MNETNGTGRGRGGVVAVVAAMVVTATNEGGAAAQTLAPPPPMGPQVAPAQREEDARRRDTEYQLNSGVADDSGRGLSFVWVDAGVGAAYANLGSVSNKTVLATHDSGGLDVDLGAGVRLLALTLGARARLMPFSRFTLWTVGGEAGFHVPGKALEPYIALHGGYLFSTRAELQDTAVPVPDNLSKVTGGTLGVAGGADYYLSPNLSVGLDGSVDALFVHQTANAASGTGSVEGGSTGYALSAVARLGVHL